MATITTDVPQRLDRLPWARFHWLVVTALGITWILDGLEVTLAGSLAGALQRPEALGLSETQIGAAASCYLAGAVAGALGFGYLTDRLGRKRLFSVTLGLYLVATAATAFSFDVWSFALFRFLTGAGIGGEYTAINSAIQELIPARYRGRTDLIINGSFWVGAALGAAATLVLLDPRLFGPDIGWRVAFFIGAALGLFVLLLRRFLPESPRWLMIHGQEDAADRVVAEIEQRIERQTGTALPKAEGRLTLRIDRRTSLLDVARTLLRTYPSRSILGIVLMTAQAFFYNAIFFTYALVLGRFYGVKAEAIGLYILPFAAGNFVGPLLLGPLFDTLGRKPMIAGTYALSGILLAVVGALFKADAVSATALTIGWSVIFFFASAAASAAYLTVSESFPLEVRALVIALFYASGTALGGIAAPVLFGHLIGSGSRDTVFYGYLLGAALMILAAIVEAVIGVKAERRSLESVAAPLSSAG